MKNFAGKDAPFEELVDFQPKQRYAFQRLLDPGVKYLLYVERLVGENLIFKVGCNRADSILQGDVQAGQC